MALIVCILTLNTSLSALNFKFNHYGDFWTTISVLKSKSDNSYYAFASKYKAGGDLPLLCKVNISGKLDTLARTMDLQAFFIDYSTNLIEWNNGFVFPETYMYTLPGKVNNKGLFYYKNGQITDLAVYLSSLDSIIEFSKMCIDSNNNLIVMSTTQKIINKTQTGGTPIVQVDSYYKIHKLSPTFQPSIILEGETTTYSRKYGRFTDVVCDKYGNIWTAMHQRDKGTGLIKIDTVNKVSYFHISTENNLTGLMPNSLQAIEDSLYVSVYVMDAKSKFNSYSVFNIANEKWSYNNDVFKNDPSVIDLIYNSRIVTKKYSYNGTEVVTTTDDGIYFKIKGDKEFRYLNLYDLNIDKSNKEFTSYIVNSVKYVDILDERLIVLTQPGIFEFTFADLIASSVENTENINYNYKLLQNKVHFENKTIASSYLISDEVGRQVKQGNFVDVISFDDFAQGVYFILLDNKQLIKIIK